MSCLSVPPPSHKHRDTHTHTLHHPIITTPNSSNAVAAFRIPQYTVTQHASFHHPAPPCPPPAGKLHPPSITILLPSIAIPPSWLLPAAVFSLPSIFRCVRLDSARFPSGDPTASRESSISCSHRNLIKTQRLTDRYVREEEVFPHSGLLFFSFFFPVSSCGPSGVYLHLNRARCCCLCSARAVPCCCSSCDVTTGGVSKVTRR